MSRVAEIRRELADLEREGQRRMLSAMRAADHERRMREESRGPAWKFEALFWAALLLGAVALLPAS